MILVRLRIMYDEYCNYFDTVLKFKDKKEAEYTLKQICDNMNLKVLDYCKVKEHEFPEFYFNETFNRENKYYIILLTI